MLLLPNLLTSHDGDARTQSQQVRMIEEGVNGFAVSVLRVKYTKGGERAVLRLILPVRIGEGKRERGCEECSHAATEGEGEGDVKTPHKV